MENYDTYKAHNFITNFINENKDHKFFIFIGGDHSITYATFKALKSVYNNLFLINIDKHFDIRDWSIDNISSGCSFSRLLDEKIISPSDLLEIGILEFYNNEKLLQKAEHYGFEYIRMMELKKNFDKFLELFKKKIECVEYIYLSFDIDVMDISVCPGSSANSPFGLNSYEVIKIFDLILETKKLIAIDIVEVNPIFDFDDMTSKFCAFLIAYILNQL